MLQGSWSFNLCSIRGVPLRIHLSFLLFLSWVLFSTQQTEGWHTALAETILFLGVFLCVLLHELGHVFVAKAFGISTKDITLYPFGGIALLQTTPKDKQELLIAIAGPAVNIIIALILFGSGLSSTHPVLQSLLEINISLALFNLIPAIPMDGGRIMRSLLSLCKVKHATAIATKVSQACSVLMAIAGIYIGSAMLCIIAFLVFMGALQESLAAHTHTAAIGRSTKEFVIEKDKLYCFTHGTTLSDALPIAMKALQDVFPIIYQDRLIGLVDRASLIDMATRDPADQYLSSFMAREFVTARADDPLLDTLALANEQRLGSIPITDAEGAFLGLLIPSHVSDFIVVDTIREDQRNFQEQADSDDFV